jgi:predicted nucleic-acid-binding protein
MELLDANFILRYLLRDNEEHFLVVRDIIEKNHLTIPDFIFAETVYVLEKVYKVPRIEIKNVLSDLLGYKNISTIRKDVLIRSLDLYKSHNLDFADALLISYCQMTKDGKLHTFDKKILKFISS